MDDESSVSDMVGGFRESTGRPAKSSFSDNTSNDDAANFECSICFDLALDPIVTLCGHLFCWPCLYKWLHIHSHCHECPVCKALAEEETLVPLYGRGKTSVDPRSKSIPGINIPDRPHGRRPETAPPPETTHFPQHGFASMGAFGGLIPSLFDLFLHDYPDPGTDGPPSNLFDGGDANGVDNQTHQGQHESFLKRLLLMIEFFVFLVSIWK